MSVLGTLTAYDDDGSASYDTFSFYNASFPDVGYPLDEAVHQLDAISAMGVNFTRERIIREDAAPFTAILHGDHDSWANAISRAQYVRRYKGRLCSITYTSGGVTHTIAKKFAIIEAGAVPMPARVVSNNLAYAAPTAIVIATLVLRYSGIDITP